MSDNVKQPRVAIVTGAAKGIGKAIALRLGQEGDLVVLLDRDRDMAASATAQLSSMALPGAFSALALDVSSEEQVQRGVETVMQRHGRIDVLVNSAGFHPRSRNEDFLIEDTPMKHWQSVLDVNLTGTFLMCRAVIPGMKAQGSGRIVNIASRAGRTGVRASGLHYAASKAGMIGMTRLLALQCAHLAITANCVAPGRIATELGTASSQIVLQASLAGIPMNRLGTPQEIAGTVAFLASADAGYITGAVIDANGGAFMGG